MTAAGGGGPPVTSSLRRGAREVWCGVREVVWWFVRAEGGRRQGIVMAAQSLADGHSGGAARARWPCFTAATRGRRWLRWCNRERRK
jgi:hypothetical protein